MPRSHARPPTLATRAYDELKPLFQNGTYEPGAFLTEGALAKRLRMSKTPVRTALVRLELEGFVTVSPQQGIVVREPSVHETFDLLDIREALETFVVRRLAKAITPEQTARLRRNLEAQEKAAQARDNLNATLLDTEFHTMLCEFIHNEEITQVMHRLRDKLHRIIMRIQTRVPERMVDGWREHASIAEAIFQGKPEQAAQRVLQHLEWARKYLSGAR